MPLWWNILLNNGFFFSKFNCHFWKMLLFVLRRDITRPSDKCKVLGTYKRIVRKFSLILAQCSILPVHKCSEIETCNNAIWWDLPLQDGFLHLTGEKITKNTNRNTIKSHAYSAAFKPTNTHQDGRLAHGKYRFNQYKNYLSQPNFSSKCRFIKNVLKIYHREKFPLDLRYLRLHH